MKDGKKEKTTSAAPRHKIKGKKRKTGRVKSVLIFLLVLICLVAASPFLVNGYVVLSTQHLLITQEEAAAKDADCILILGAGLNYNGTPSLILKDRLDRGIELYSAGAAPKLLLSGDSGNKYYNEVNAMKKYAMEAGVPERDLLLDYAGFSTYESMYRAREVFDVECAIVVTQKYHEHRALYIGRGLGLDVHGVTAKDRNYVEQNAWDQREFLARCKDFYQVIVKTKPTYQTNVIPVEGDGLLPAEQR